ncbi:glycosyltransferase family 2 protein [Endothiovibrio diazotrophicus]
MAERAEGAVAQLSVILPAKNEARGLAEVLPRLRELYPEAQVIVVDDGSDDDTAEVARRYGAEVVSHPYGMGNGAAVKNGARAARGERLLFMDADGQHRPEEIARLLAKYDEGYRMVVGARAATAQASLGRSLANRLYNRLASWMVGHPVADLTSGMRLVSARHFREFLHLLPNGFSYPTTCTMAFFRAGYPVAYLPVAVEQRIGKSHIRILRDGTRFLLIIFKIGSLYSPLKLFFPVSFGLFSAGLSYYIYTYLTSGRFTNMGALLFIVSIVVFMIGLVSEQITALMYRKD